MTEDMNEAQQKIPAGNPDNRSFQGCLDKISEQDAEIARLKYERDQWDLEAGKAWEDLKRVTYDKGVLGDLLYKMEAKANRQAVIIIELSEWLRRWKGAQNDVVELLMIGFHKTSGRKKDSRKGKPLSKVSRIRSMNRNRRSNDCLKH